MTHLPLVPPEAFVVRALGLEEVREENAGSAGAERCLLAPEPALRQELRSALGQSRRIGASPQPDQGVRQLG